MENEPNQQPPDTNGVVPPAEPGSHQVTLPGQKKSGKPVIFIVGGIVLALLALGAAYWFFLRDSGESQQEQNPTAGQQQTEAPAPAPADPTPVQYKSGKLNLEFTHRKDWSAKESGDGEVTVTSPNISYTRTDGEATNGVFTLKIRKGVPDAMKTTIEKAVAPIASEVIAYAEPTEEQREYTNLSYAGTKDVFNFFIVTGSVELKAGNAFAYTLAMDGDFYLIVGGYGTDKDGTLSFDSIPKESMDSTALGQAVNIVESLRIY